MIALFSFSCGNKQKSTQSVQTVKVFTAVGYGAENSVSFPGKIKAASDVNLSFRIGGPIKKIYAEVGDFVKKGDVIAEIDSRDYAVQLSATQAEYNQIKAEAERVIALYEKKGVTPNDYDKAEYGLQQITAKLDAHRNALADTKLRAQFDGYVQKRFFDSGETVGPGMPVVSMVSTTHPEVEIFIPSSDFIRRSDFVGYECSVDILPGISFPLELIGIAKKANLNQLYAMRLRLAGNAVPVPSPGMSATVTISLKPTNSELVTVPLSAVFEDGNISSVWVFNRDSQTVERREIKVGEIHLDGMVVITSGLKEGEIVVSAGVSVLKEGQGVRPLQPVSKSNVGGLL